MNEKLKLMVGSETVPGRNAAEGVAWYRVVSHKDGRYSTVDLEANGTVKTNQEPYEWGPNWPESRHIVISNPPASVGDMVTSGSVVYEVESYDPLTDITTIKVTGSTMNPRESITEGTFPPSYSYTRHNWPSVLRPYVMTPPVWQPEIGKLAKITAIADCCASHAKSQGVEVGDVRKLESRSIGESNPFSDAHWCTFGGVDGGIDCELAEPGAPYVPAHGEEVIITAITTGGTGHYVKQSRHKVGDRVKVNGRFNYTMLSGDSPGYVYLTDLESGNRSWCIVKKAPAAEKAPVAVPVVAPVFVPKKGDKVKITAVAKSSQNQCNFAVGSIHTVGSAELYDREWAETGGAKIGDSYSVLLFDESGSIGAYVHCELVKEEPKKKWSRDEPGHYVEITYIGMDSIDTAKRLGVSVGDVRKVAKIESFTGRHFEGVGGPIWCDVKEPEKQETKIVKPAEKPAPRGTIYDYGRIAFTPWDVIPIGAPVKPKAQPSPYSGSGSGSGTYSNDFTFRLLGVDFVNVEKAAASFAATSAKWETEKRLEAAKKQLGPNALSLLADLAERLAKGAKEHGDFEKPRSAKEWTKEAYEEDLDGIVYRAMRVKAA